MFTLHYLDLSVSDEYKYVSDTGMLNNFPSFFFLYLEDSFEGLLKQK